MFKKDPIDTIFKLGILIFLFAALVVAYLVLVQAKKQPNLQHQIGQKFSVNGHEVNIKEAIVSDFEGCDGTISRSLKVKVDYLPGLDNLYAKMLTTSGVLVTDSHGNYGDQMEFFVKDRLPGNQDDSGRSYKLQFIDGSEAILIPFKLEFKPYTKPTPEDVAFMKQHGFNLPCQP